MSVQTQRAHRGRGMRKAVYPVKTDKNRSGRAVGAVFLAFWAEI